MSENDLNNPLDEALKAGKLKSAGGKKKTVTKKKARPEFVMLSGTVIAEAYYGGYRLHEGDRATVKCPVSDKHPHGRIPTWLKPDR